MILMKQVLLASTMCCVGILLQGCGGQKKEFKQYTVYSTPGPCSVGVITSFCSRVFLWGGVSTMTPTTYPKKIKITGLMRQKSY
jgi:hypothetical protein